MFPCEAQIAEEPSHAESYNVLPTDFGASQFVVKSLLLCENQKKLTIVFLLSSEDLRLA